MNAIVNTTEPRTTSLQLPKETESLIKASVAENTLKAYQAKAELAERGAIARFKDGKAR